MDDSDGSIAKEGRETLDDEFDFDPKKELKMLPKRTSVRTDGHRGARKETKYIVLHSTATRGARGFFRAAKAPNNQAHFWV